MISKRQGRNFTFNIGRILEKNRIFIYIFIHKIYIPNLILLHSNELFINDFNMSSMSNSSNFSLCILQIISAFYLLCDMLFLKGVSHYKYFRQLTGNILTLKRFSIKLTTILVRNTFTFRQLV